MYSFDKFQEMRTERGRVEQKRKKIRKEENRGAVRIRLLVDQTKHFIRLSHLLKYTMNNQMMERGKTKVNECETSVTVPMPTTNTLF